MNGRAAPPAVTFESVTKSYGQVQAVRDLSFTVAAGQIVAMLGLNGAGKSTVIDLIAGLRRPDRGRVTVLGGSPEAAVAGRQISTLVQASSLPVGAKVREIIDLSRCLYGKQRTLEQALELVGVAGIAGRRCDSLSGGQRQRVRIGMAVAGRPDLMILDEPTVALDVEARQHVWSALRAIAGEGTTILFSTHYLAEAETAADQTVLLRAGRLAAQGPPEQVTAAMAATLIRFRIRTPDRAWLAALDGVTGVAVEGDQVRLHCRTADDVLARLYQRYCHLDDVSITSGGLEDAVLALAHAQPGEIPARPEEVAA